MPFWDAQHPVDSPSLRMAVGCLGAYAALTLGYLVWEASTIGVQPHDAGQAVVRVACALGLGYGLLKRMRWARSVGLCSGLLGGLGLVILGFALANTGVSTLPLGVVTAAYAGSSAVCLCLVGIHLARDDAREAFAPPTTGATLGHLK